MTETDQELLEMAAKAIDLSRQWWDYEFCRRLGHMVTPSMMWNPLTDDCAALKLILKLATKNPGASFTLSISKMHDGRGFADAGFYSHINPSASAIDSDLAAAVRRAIVRSAAEIGRAMP